MTKAKRENRELSDEDRDIVRKYKKCHFQMMNARCDQLCDGCPYGMDKATYLRAQMLARW